MITYTDSLAYIGPDQLQGGFFVGWPEPPDVHAHYRILRGSAAIVVAQREDGNVVGFITAISDGVSCAYIPHLEVLPAYQAQGIGSELLQRMLAKLGQLYMIDLICDPDVQPFYARFGMQPWSAMVLRNHDRQSCSVLDHE